MRSERHRGAALLAVAVVWVVGSAGVTLRPWAVLVAMMVLAVLVVHLLGRGARWPKPLSWLVALLAWTAVAAVLRPVATYPAAAAVAVAVVAVLIGLAAQDPRVRAAAHPALTSAALLTAVWLVAERIIVGHRPGGPFGNPNPGATVILLGLAVTPWLRAALAVRIGIGSVLVTALLASGSRAAMLGAVAMATSWAFAQGALRLRAGVAVIALAAAGGLAFRLASDSDPLRFERLRIWGVGVRAALAELPLGAGPGGFVDAALPHNFPRLGEFALYHRIPSSAESDLLQLAVTLGIPGLVLGGGLFLAFAAQLRRAGALGCGVAAAIIVTSSLHSQLMFPVVAWTATLAVTGCGRPAAGRRLRLPFASAVALTVGIAAPVAVALGVGGGAQIDLAGPVEAARRLTPATLASDAALADAEAELWQACAARPRFAHAWRVLGAVRLRRAELRRDAGLVGAAVAAFSEARRSNPLDAWAALGLGQSFRLSGRVDEATEALRAATAIEPNCVAAWLELGRLQLELGEVGRAAGALRQAEAAMARAEGRRFVTGYERALAAADPVLLSALRAATGAR